MGANRALILEGVRTRLKSVTIIRSEKKEGGEETAHTRTIREFWSLCVCVCVVHMDEYHRHGSGLELDAAASRPTESLNRIQSTDRSTLGMNRALAIL